MKLTPELKAQIDNLFNNTSLEEFLEWFEKRGVVFEDIDKPKSKTQLTFTKVNEVIYNISFNNCDLGKLCCIEDGFFYWFPPKFDGGFIDSWILKQIYEYVDELNRPYNESIDRFFENEKKLSLSSTIETEEF